MFNSTTLEVAIGMALVYLLLSLFCTAINEAIAGIMNSRAKNLERGIKSLFTEGRLSATVSLTDAIYRHGLVQSLYRSGTSNFTKSSEDLKHLPAYIPSRIFSSALYDVLFPNLLNPWAATAGGSPTPTDAQTHLNAMLAAIDAIQLKSPGLSAIRTLVNEANGDVEKTRLSFERWFDDGMDRAAGWYKKRTQRALFLIGLVAAIVLNVDTIVVARNLWSNPAMRSFAVGYADKVANDTAIRATITRQTAQVGNDANRQNHNPNVQTSPNVPAHPALALPGATVPAKPGNAASSQQPSTGTSGPTKDDAKSNTTDSDSSPVAVASKNLEDLKSLNLPIGWKESELLSPYSKERETWPQRFRLDLAWQAFKLGLLGWFLTAIAMTLGAPFWFDTLNQFMVVRSTIKPREKSDVEGSKDSKKN